MDDEDILTLKWAYHLLGVEERAPDHAIRKAYKEAMKIWHPDRWANEPARQAEALEKTKEINAAYDKIRHAPLRYRVSRKQEQKIRAAAAKPPEERPRRYRKSATLDEYRRRQRRAENEVRLFSGFIVGIGLAFLISHGFLFHHVIAHEPELAFLYLGLGVACALLSKYGGDDFWYALVEAFGQAGNWH